MPVRLAFSLLVTMASFITACDQGSSFDEGSAPSHPQSLSEDHGNNGQVGVEIRVNHNPRITAMTAEWIGPDQQRVSAMVADRDGDALSFAWSMDCAGGIDDPHAATPTLAFARPLPPTCTIHLDVNDGQGGTHAGELTLALPSVAVEVESE